MQLGRRHCARLPAMLFRMRWRVFRLSIYSLPVMLGSAERPCGVYVPSSGARASSARYCSISVRVACSIACSLRSRACVASCCSMRHQLAARAPPGPGPALAAPARCPSRSACADEVGPLLLVAGLGIPDGLGTDRHLGRIPPHRRPLQRQCAPLRRHAGPHRSGDRGPGPASRHAAPG